MGKWSELPCDLLNNIDGQLWYIDKVRMRAVCESWYSRLPKIPNIYNHKLRQLPWLLHEFVNNKVTSHGHSTYVKINFIGLIYRRQKGGTLEDLLMVGWCWLLESGEDIYAGSPDICLINPLTRVQIQLPHKIYIS